MKSKICLLSVLICLTMLVSMMNFSTVQANRESASPTFIPSISLPAGNTYTKTPTFYWRGKSEATYYRISVFRKSDNLYILHNLYLSAATYCRFNFCKFTPTTYENPIAYGTEYKWKIAAGNADGLGSYTPLVYFTPKTGINSNFTSNANGWQPKVGSWRITAEGYYKGTSSTTQFVSSRYDGIFNNFTFEARVMMPGSDTNYPHGVIIRGDTSAYLGSKMWNSGYFFAISDYGDYLIMRYDPGTSKNLAGWNLCDAINADGFNTLKVNAYGPYMNFYINGSFVDQVFDSTYTSGRVGLIGFYNGASFNIDYAKLNMPMPSYSIRTETVGRPSNNPFIP